MNKHIINIKSKLCIGCGLCQRDCPSSNIIINDKMAMLKNQQCIKCGHCVAICPKAAVSMTGFEETPIEIDQATTMNAKDLLIALQTRRSIRQFKAQSIPHDIIEQIIEAGRYTPTAKNAQDIHYLVLEKEKTTYELMAVQFFRKLIPIVRLFYAPARDIIIEDDFFFKKAPLAILILTKDKVSGSLAASNMALMAEANGLGVLYSGFFSIAANHSRKLRRTLNIKHTKVVTTLVLGYPNVQYHRTVQKEKAKIRFL